MCWHVLLCSGWVLLVMLLLLLHLLLLLLQWMVNIRQWAGFEWCIWSSMRYDWFQSSIRWYMLQIVEYCYHCYCIFETFCLQINCYDLHNIIDDVRWQGSEWRMQNNTDYLLVWLVKQIIVFFFVSNNLQSKDIINIYLTNSYSSSISNRSQILYFYSPFPLQEKKPAQHGIAQTLHHTLVYQYISHCQRNKDVQLTGQAKLRVLRFKSPKLHHIIDMQSIDHSEYNNNTRQGLFQHNTQYIIHKRYPCNSSTKTKFSITLGLCKFW